MSEALIIVLIAYLQARLIKYFKLSERFGNFLKT